jgi:hypothetical protein
MGVAAVGAAQFVARNVALTGEAYYSRSTFRVKATADGVLTNEKQRSEEWGLQFGIRVFLY